MELVHFPLETLPEVLEGDDHHGDIVKTALSYRRFQYRFNSCSTVLMDRLAPVFEIFLCSFPPSLHDLGVSQLIVDAIAAQYYKVVIILNLEALNVWSGNDNFRVALVLRPFGFDVSESPRDREPSREYPMRSQQYLLPHLTRFPVFILNFGHRLCPIRIWSVRYILCFEKILTGKFFPRRI